MHRPEPVKWYGRVAVVSLAAVAASTPTPPDLVERFYSLHVYTAIQRPITGLSNKAPFALLDALVLVVAGAWLAFAFRDLTRTSRTGRLRTAAAIGARTVVWAAVLYMIFLFVWGLNYRRIPLVEKLPFDARTVTPDAARLLALTAVDQLNTLYDQAHAS